MDEYLAALRNRTQKLYALEKVLPPVEAVRVRRTFIEEETGTDLEHVGAYTMAIDQAVKKNIENMIGAVQIPVGVAGPLRVHGEYADGEYYLPLATTEGALVASVNRGCSAITAAGGAEVRIIRDGMTRAPVFATDSVIHARSVVDWVNANQDRIRAVAESTTSHGRLIGTMTSVAGTSVYLRLEFDTKDAMGMNMATIAATAVSTMVAEETGARLIAVSGNLCIDKKPAAINVVLGRGKTVVAGVHLTEDLCRRIFKTSAAIIAEVNMRKNLVGSARAGALGFNAQAANVIAAMFIACGQDPAHVVEGSSCITTVDPVKDGIYVAVTIPALQVGTVGGGTGLSTQRECLALLGVNGGGEPAGSHAKKLAEIIAAGVLAGELSLLGALGAGHLARAHQQLGRGEISRT
jgi:hydroxymethylglutaryl-CoA reductase (NADPH)